MGGCASAKSIQKKYSISSKRTSSSLDNVPGLMRLEIACMEFEHQLKAEIEKLQKVFETNKKTINDIIEKGQSSDSTKMQGSSLKLINSMNQIKIYEMLLECCSGIEEETHNLLNKNVTDQVKSYICNIIWSASKLKNVTCIQEFKQLLEPYVNLSKTDLSYSIDPELRGLFSKLSES
ncbi:hypothetical protein ABPG74_016908 [Tetrahymena malaccensis]